MMRYPAKTHPQKALSLALVMLLLCVLALPADAFAKKHLRQTEAFASFCAKGFFKNDKFVSPNLAAFTEKVWAFQRVHNETLSSLDELRDAFTHIDQDGDQRLSLSELGAQKKHIQERFTAAPSKKSKRRGPTLRPSHL